MTRSVRWPVQSVLYPGVSVAGAIPGTQLVGPADNRLAISFGVSSWTSPGATAECFAFVLDREFDSLPQGMALWSLIVRSFGGQPDSMALWQTVLTFDRARHGDIVLGPWFGAFSGGGSAEIWTMETLEGKPNVVSK